MPRRRRVRRRKQRALRRRQNRVRRLPWEKKQALAERVYNNTWNQVAKFYGIEGAPPPLANFQQHRSNVDLPYLEPSQNAYVHAQPGTGIRQVNIGRPLARELAVPGWERRRGKKTLLHEWAHVFQSPELLNQYLANQGNQMATHDQEQRELLAEELANQIFTRRYPSRGMRKARRKGKKPRPGPMPPRIYEQFGTNFGRDPRTIRYPGFEPSAAPNRPRRKRRRVRRGRSRNRGRLTAL